MAERTPEDRLREEYFVLLPVVRRVMEELEAEVRHCLLPLSSKLHKHERLVVTSRVKDCESALGALRRRQEGATFDSDKTDSYTLTSLNDLAGVRVLAFPRSRRIEADFDFRQRFKSWASDPVPADDGGEKPLAFKYHGLCAASTMIRGELQIAPMLVGLFWDVEHSTVYKPSPELKGVGKTPEMRRRRSEVLTALKAFENEFERIGAAGPIRRVTVASPLRQSPIHSHDLPRHKIRRPQKVNYRIGDLLARPHAPRRCRLQHRRDRFIPLAEWDHAGRD